jgi:hypothetical protein
MKINGLYEIYREDGGNGITFVHMLYYIKVVIYFSIMELIFCLYYAAITLTLSVLSDSIFSKKIYIKPLN